MNNLKPACISCNRSKRSAATRAVRAKNGWSSAPLSKKEKNDIRVSRAIGGGLIGGAAGAALGPIGAIVGAGIGALLGDASGQEE